MICKHAIEVYGTKNQMMQCIEEMAELTQAINKYFRAESLKDKISAYDKIAEETADVQIMIEQMRIMFDADVIDDYIKAKKKRLEERLAEMRGAK